MAESLFCSPSRPCFVGTKRVWGRSSWSFWAHRTNLKSRVEHTVLVGNRCLPNLNEDIISPGRRAEFKSGSATKYNW